MEKNSLLPDLDAYAFANSLHRAELQKLSKNGSPLAACFLTPQFAPSHDIYNVYRYGDLYKVVYIKARRSPKTPPHLVFADPAYTPSGAPDVKSKVATSPPTEAERFSSSLKRSKATIFELAMCNEFKYFCTFTLDEKLKDRFDLATFRKSFAQLVRNINRTKTENKIEYLVIPEHHKNGAWHAHGLLKGLDSSDLRLFTLSETLPYSIRQSLLNGIPVYNWERYSRAFGYFTATPIKDTTACSKYITKYVCKEFSADVFAANSHLFYASQGLKRRETIVKNCLDPLPTFEWDFENQYIKVAEFPKDTPMSDFWDNKI